MAAKYMLLLRSCWLLVLVLSLMVMHTPFENVKAGHSLCLITADVDGAQNPRRGAKLTSHLCYQSRNK